MVKIYTLACPNTGQIRYVGKTTRDLRFRLYDHTSNHRLAKETSYKNSWIKSIKPLKPVIEIIDEVKEDEWIFWEQFYISLFTSWGYSLTNMTSGGEGCIGGKGCKGYKHTEDAKRRISIANSKPKSEEWIKNASRGKYKPILQYDLKGNFIREWESSTTAAISLGDISYKKNISAVCKEKRNSAYGYTWKFKL